MADEELAQVALEIDWFKPLVLERQESASTAPEPATPTPTPATAQKPAGPAPDNTQPAKPEQGENK